MTLSITTLSIQELNVILSISDTQHKSTVIMLSAIMLNVFTLSVVAPSKKALQRQTL
jgi:hypothetical protein